MRRWPAFLALAVLAAAPLAAQNPALPAPTPAARPNPADTLVRDTTARRPTRGDSVRPVAPVTPGGAFLRSLIIPGWGQARVGRNVTGGIFLLWEGVCQAMLWKAEWQLRYARERGKFVQSHVQEREDWIVLLVFNHLLAGAEAYVSANLYDFPAALKLQTLPGGRTGVGVSVQLK